MPIFATGPQGRDFLVDENGRLIAIEGGQVPQSGLLPYSFGPNGRPIVVDDQGRMVLSPSGVTNNSLYSIRGALDDFDVVMGEQNIPLSSLATVGSFTLSENDDDDWRSGDILTVPVDKGGKYILSAHVSHPSTPIAGGNSQEALGVCTLGLNLNSTYIPLSLDDAAGVPENWHFTIPMSLSDGDTITLRIDIGTARTNEDFLVLFSLVRL